MKSGTFIVTSVDEGAATMRDVNDQQVLTLDEHPALETGEVLEATVEPRPPLEVVYRIVEIDSRRTIPVERTPMAPTAMETEMATDQEPGAITRRQRAGEGEIHVLTVPPDRTDRAATAVVDDQETIIRAARLGVDRVEVRTADGAVSVRYLPS